MRRIVGLLAVAAFATTLHCAVARASSPFDAIRPDLGSQVMLRLFGETGDSNASFAAVRGDRTSESPLRELALQLPRTPEAPAFTSGIAATPVTPAVATTSNVSGLERAFDASLLRGGDQFFASPSASDAATLKPPSALLTAAYQPIAPVPDISPAPGTLAFGTAAASKPLAFTPVTAQVGGLAFDAHVDGSSLETPALSLHDNTSTAGANFQVRAGKRDINLNLNTQYEHLARNDNNFSSALDTTAPWHLPGADAPLVIPSYADLNRVSLGAGVAVPVLRGMTLNLNYGVQHLYGGYGLPGLFNLDAVNNTYGGKLTFNIPDASKTLSISAYQERFSDSVLPLNGYSQTHEDVNFTVKF